MAKFISGRAVNRGGTVDGKELDARLNTIDSFLSKVNDSLSVVSAASSAAASSASSVSLDSPNAPTLVSDGAYPPTTSDHWLRANYPKADPSGSTIIPFVKIRIMLPSGIRLESSVYTLVMAVWNTTQSLGIQVTRNLSSHDVSDGYCDLVVPTADMAMGDSCYPLLVALAANGGYAENVYDAAIFPFTAGAGIGPPETPGITVLHTKPHHTDFQLAVVYTYDSTDPYNGPNCCNFYDKLEVYKSETASLGDTPDTPGTTGWWEAEHKPLQGLIKRIKVKASDNKKSITVNHKASVNLRMAFRIHQADGQVGAWTTYTVGQPGVDDPDYVPGYLIVSGAYAPGGASNPWSNAATDPGTGCWNAEEDLPGTPGKEVSVRVRLYFTATDGGTAPAANANNLHGSLHLKEYNATTGLYRHFTPEFSVAAPATDTYVDVEFKHKFKKGRTISFVVGVLKNHGETHTATFSQTAVAGGGSITAAPLAPTLGAATHTKMASVWPVTLNSDATHFLADLRKLALYTAVSGSTGTPDSNPGAWTKRKTMDIEDDVAAGRTSVELSINRPSAARKAAIARCKDAYGQWGAWSVISDTGTPPGTDDTPPSVPTITATSSYLRDLKGTPRKECDLTVSFTAPGCTAVEVAVVDPDGTEKKHIKVTGSGTETVYWKHKFDYGDALAITIMGINGTAESAWSSATNTTAGASTAALPSQTVLAPVITSCIHTRMGSVYTITLPNNAGTVYDCIRKIQFWWAPTGTAAPTGQATPSATWKKIKTVDVDELAGGTNATVEIPVNRPAAARKAAVCRIVDAAGRKSDWSNGYDTGTPPGTDDTPPDTPAIGTLTSYVKDKPGTARVECDLTVPLTWTNANADHAIITVSDDEGTTSVNVKCSGTSKVYHFKAIFNRGVTLSVTAQLVNGTALGAETSASTILAGATTGAMPAAPGTPVLTRIKVGDHRNKYRYSLASGDSADTAKAAREIEVWSAAKGSSAIAPATWAASQSYTGHATETIGDTIIWDATACQYYRCLVSHVSAADTEPGVGVNWAAYWELRSSPNAAGATTPWEPEPERAIATGAKAGKRSWVVVVTKDYKESIAAAMRHSDVYGRSCPFVYNDASVAAMTVTVNAPVISGLAVNFPAATVANGTAPYSYSWDFGDGSALDTSADPASHTYAAPGTYRVRLTVTDAASPQQAVVSEYLVTVPVATGALVATLTATPTSGAATLAVTFSVGGTGGSGTYTYDLNYGDGTAHGTSSGTHNYTAAGTYTATLIVTDTGAGGGSTSTTVAITVTSGVGYGAPSAYCGTATGTGWTSPSYAQGADNATFAVAAMPAVTTSPDLALSNFGFAIPTGAVIDGITVAFRIKASSSTNVLDNSIKISKTAGTGTGTDHMIGNPVNVTSSWVVYGSALDLWGTTWIAAEINATGFGVVASWLNNNVTLTKSIYVDAVLITVYYH